MKKMVILPEASAYLPKIREIAPDWEIIITDDDETACAHIAQAEILADWSRGMAKACLESDSIRWVQTWGAGVERFPLQEFRQKGIVLTNASGVHAYPITESVFAMMLCFARGVRGAIARQESGQWRSGGLNLTEMHGKTMGILGVGAIGTETARIAKAFGMRVLGLRRGGGQAPYVDAMFAPEEVGRMLPECDYLVNLLPATSLTRHFMNARRFAAMKKTACYVSAGRGQTTDQEALIKALEDGVIACAALDVTDPEPLPADNPLWRMENVIITPHISGMTDQYFRRAVDIFLENLAAYVKTGAPAANIVRYDLEY